MRHGRGSAAGQGGILSIRKESPLVHFRERCGWISSFPRSLIRNPDQKMILESIKNKTIVLFLMDSSLSEKHTAGDEGGRMISVPAKDSFFRGPFLCALVWPEALTKNNRPGSAQSDETRLMRRYPGAAFFSSERGVPPAARSRPTLSFPLAVLPPKGRKEGGWGTAVPHGKGLLLPHDLGGVHGDHEFLVGGYQQHLRLGVGGGEDGFLAPDVVGGLVQLEP